MSFRVHQSNRLERLAEVLADCCQAPLHSAFAAESIVVPNTGMQRWLSLRLAERLGICANVRFALPAAFAWDVWKRVLDDVPDAAAFSAPVLAWRIFGALEEAGDTPAFAPLRAALGAADELQRFELAAHVADVFDQYLVYRPDVVLGWEDGRHETSPPSRDERWQAELWRRIAGPAQPRHRARLADAFRATSSSRLADAGLPERVHVFGIPALAPVYLRTFGRIAEVADVHFYVVNPCREYWFDILPQSEIARRSGDHDPADLYLETGNPLLASMGLQGRDYMKQFVEDLDSGESAFEDPLDEAEHPTLLDVVQSDILGLRTRGGVEPRALDEPRCLVDPFDAADDDRSVQIHVCHSPMREVEVLHDQLLDLFERCPDLEPSEVRVMTPDIETYAPLIDAVFAAAPDARRIPYAIADRQPRAERSAVAAFLALLDLPRGRFEATALLSLLETASVRARFALEEADLPAIAAWVRTAGIRWGIDAAHRTSLDLPGTQEHSWRFGIDRLLLGHAMAGEDEFLFDGILPVDDVEGPEVTLLARLDDFAEALFALARDLEQPRSPREWSTFLEAMQKRFFDDGADEEDRETIAKAIGDFTDECHHAGFEAPLDRAVMAHVLDRLLRAPGGAWAFLSGSVTFCTMVPMRNIPARVVCLLGMSDGAFPRSRRPPSFDLVAQRPRAGDRATRDDDRYLFLEAILSARHTLYVSYVGRHIRDNAESPPSILVSELADAIHTGARRNDRPADVETVHPLQGFSPRYFTGEGKLFSYVSELCTAAEAARVSVGARPGTGAFVPQRLAEPGDEMRSISLDVLLRFYRNPARFLLRDRLGLILDEQEALIESTEPFVLDQLARHAARHHCLRLLRAGRSDDEVREILHASAALPHGQIGDRVLEDLLRPAHDVHDQLVPLLAGDPAPPESLDLDLDGFRLVGTLGGLTRSGLVDLGFGDVKARDRLQLWIRHLVLNIIEPPGVERRSHWVHDAGTLAFGPIEAPLPVLQRLAEIYWEGLQRPLPLFSDQSHKKASGKKVPEELEGLLKDDYDAYAPIAFRGASFDPDDFDELAIDVFGPLVGAGG